MRINLTGIIRLLVVLLTGFSVAEAQKLQVVVQSGHLSKIEKMAFSADGKILASADADGLIKLWDLATYKEIDTINIGLDELAGAPNALAFSSDSKTLFILAQDRSAYAIEIANGRKTKLFGKSGKYLNFSGATIHIGKMFAAQLTDNGEIQVVNLTTGEKRFVARLASEDTTDSAVLTSLAFNPEGSLLASALSGGKIALFNTATGRIFRTVESREASCLTFSPDGKKIAACEKDEKGLVTSINLRLTENSAVTKNINITTGEIVYISFSPDAKKLVGILKRKIESQSSDEYVVRFWDSETGKDIRELTVGDVASQILFSPDGQTLSIAYGESNGRIALLDVETGRDIVQLKRQSGAVHAIRYLKNGQFTADSSGLRVWDLTNGRQLRNQILAEYAISSDSKRLAAYNVLIHTFEVKDIDSQNQIAKLNWKNFDMTSNALMFSPDDSLLLVYASPVFPARPEDRLMLFSPETGEPLFIFPDNAKIVAFSPDGKWLSYGMTIDEKNQKFAVKVWDVVHRKLVQTIEYQNQIRALAFSKSGERLAVASYHLDEKFLGSYYLDLYGDSGRKLVRNFGEMGIVDALAFNPDGTVLASGDSESIKLWNASDGTNINSLKGHGSYINSLSFSPDNKTLASGSSDGQIIFWDFKKSSLTSRLIVVNDFDYIFVTPENYYYASRKGAAAAIAFRDGLQAFPFEQFDIRFHRPDLVLKTLGTTDAELINIYARAYQKRLNQYNLKESDLTQELKLPTVTILTKTIPNVTKQKSLDFQIQADDTTLSLSRLNVYVNDIPVYGSKGLNLADLKAKSVTRKVSLELSLGDNRVQVSAVNEKGIESIRQTFKVRYDGPVAPSELYILAIGVTHYTNSSFDLTYPAKDAASIIKLFEDRSAQKEKGLTGPTNGSDKDARMKSFYRVHPMLLADKDATKEKIIAARNFLNQAKTDDQIIVFISGHGLLDKANNYFFATHNINFDNPASGGLSYNVLENLLDGLPARRKLILLDTCHSGEVDKGYVETLKITEPVSNADGVIKSLDVKIKSATIELAPNSFDNSLQLAQELFADLRLGSGAFVISASGGLEYAYESQSWSGGVFTYALRLGLGDLEADQNEDGKISASEIRNFVQAKVSELTKGKQRPTFRRESIEFDFIVY